MVKWLNRKPKHRIMNKKRNYNLDWIRVIALIGVVLDHYMMTFKGCDALVNGGIQMGGECYYLLIS